MLEKVKGSQLSTYVNKCADNVNAALEKVKEAQIRGQESAVALVEQAIGKMKGVKELTAEGAHNLISQLSKAWDALMENGQGGLVHVVWNIC